MPSCFEVYPIVIYSDVLVGLKATRKFRRGISTTTTCAAVECSAVSRHEWICTESWGQCFILLLIFPSMLRQRGRESTQSKRQRPSPSD